MEIPNPEWNALMKSALEAVYEEEEVRIEDRGDGGITILVFDMYGHWEDGPQERRDVRWCIVESGDIYTDTDQSSMQMDYDADLDNACSKLLESVWLLERLRLAGMLTTRPADSERSAE